MALVWSVSIANHPMQYLKQGIRKIAAGYAHNRLPIRFSWHFSSVTGSRKTHR